jgi:hypothetical protein
MRRIIERVVTVVTTTTWTITLQDDALHPDPQTGSDADSIPKPEVLSVIEIKEADPPESKTETDPMADEPPQDPYPHYSKIERNEKP